jgi:hypothetical protein
MSEKKRDQTRPDQAGQLVHIEEGLPNFVLGKGSAKTGGEGRGIWVQGVQPETPPSRCDRAEKFPEEVFEDSCFSRMRGDGGAITVKSGNRVAAETTGSRGVKELGVLISFKGEAHFSPKPPVDSFLLDCKVKSVHGKGAEVVFVGGKRSVLLQHIQKVDKDTAVVFLKEGGGGTFRPSFAAEAALPKTRDNLGGGVMSSCTSPGRPDDIFKTIVEPPNGVVPKMPPFRDDRGDSGNEGDVV